ncbi:MAG: PD-(D/E)XK nuclease domain-containing protein [Pseudomonadota bacterium]
MPRFEELDKAQRVARIFSQTGDMQPLCDFMEDYYFKVFDNRDYRLSNELTIKTAFLTLLFNDVFYIMDSETALERGYADLTMIVRPDMRRYKLLDILIEFKYLNLSDTGLKSSEIKSKSFDELKALSSVQEQLTESKAQLAQYQKGLKAKYGEVLQLRTYSVIALGFERVVWFRVA